MKRSTNKADCITNVWLWRDFQT